MKVTICNDCGLTMHTGVTVCRRCNQKRLACYDIHCASDTYVLHKRVDELNPHFGPRHSHPFVSGLLIVGITVAVVIGYENVVHPYGVVAKQTNSVMVALKPKPQTTNKTAAKRPARSM